ncbi:hypothetical protein DVH05_014110 [Phytophthora capsici]|nr:hypothetical protein DVH05_014110 [Phytophthora capsici]
MRWTSILLVAAAALTGVLDASTSNTVANPGVMESAFSPVIHDHRSLRLVEDDAVDDDEDESVDEVDEERTWFSNATQARDWKKII